MANEKDWVRGELKKVMQLYATERCGLGNRSDEIDQLLERISENAFSNIRFDFYKGITGVGWCIELLSQHQLLNVDTNDLLEELDDAVFNYFFSNPHYDVSVDNGLLGLFLYYRYRHTSTTGLHHYRWILNEECLTLIIGSINKQLSDKEAGLLLREEFSPADYFHLWLIMYFFSDLFELRVNQKATEQVLYHTITSIDKHLEKTMSEKKGDPVYLFLTAHFYYVAGVKHIHGYWKTRAILFIKHFASVSEADDLLALKMKQMANILAHNYGFLANDRKGASTETGCNNIEDNEICQGALLSTMTHGAFEIYYLLTFFDES